MGRFLNELRVEKVTHRANDRLYQLTEPLIYDSNTVGTIIVPKGFKTDFSSVPRLPFAFWFFGAIGDEAGALHDYLYTDHITGCNGTAIDRATADKILRGAIYHDLMMSIDEYESFTVGNGLKNLWAYFTAWCFWVAVRGFGGGRWK